MKQIVNILIFCSLVAVLSTVFAVDHLLWQGVTTGKYFWFAAALCICMMVALPVFLYQQGGLRITDIFAGLFAGYLCINYFLLNDWPSMHWWLFLLMLPLYVIVRMVGENPQLRQRLLDAILVIVLIEAVWGLLQLYGFKYSYHSLYRITGSLFNPGPYSGFVAVGVPLALAYALDKKLPCWERWLGIITLAAAGLVLPAAMSRAAWLAAIVGSIPVLWQYLVIAKNKRQQENHSNNPNDHHRAFQRLAAFRQRRSVRIAFIFAICIVGTGLLAGLYYLKKDSADGRWLMWNVSAEIMKEHPLFGAGYDCFAAVYGDAQASYFLEGKGTDAQVMVADSPDNAFNEYVQMAVELGVVGLVLFLLVAGSLFAVRGFSSFIPRRELSGNKNLIGHPSSVARHSLITFLVFAAFSYPFSVLPLTILFVVLLALSTSSSRKLSFSIPLWLRMAGSVLCVGITIYSACQILPRKIAYREWPSVQTLYHAEIYTKALKDYQILYPLLGHEKQFLFEYGQCLSKTGQYEESNRIFHEFLHYGSDPMIYNCMGNNFKAMEDYSGAEAAYIHASQIVPNRHYPLYLLMKLYQESGQMNKARTTAQTLLDKPVKVKSTAIREMQEEAKQLIIKE